MKKLWQFINNRYTAQVVGIAIGIAAIYFSVKNINSNELKESLSAVKPLWLVPIVLSNFIVIALKSLRWRIMLKRIKRIAFWLMFRVLTIGYMANNILPARLGEAVRIHMLGKDAEVSRSTTTASLISDRIIEAVSFLLLAASLILFTNVPKWMHYGLTVTLIVTVVGYTVAIIYSTRDIEHKFLKKFQEGIRPLLHWNIFLEGSLMSLLSWFVQLGMIYMTQVAFGVSLPFWSALLVLIAVNLAIIVPSAPAQLGTFELACVLAYTSMGLDKGTALLIGATYHLMQIIPITITGGLFIMVNQLRFARRRDLSADIQAQPTSYLE